LCSAALLPAVTSCGILPFKVLSSSDHRSVFVDFDTKLLFGSLPLELASSKTPQFHSRDYENSETYTKAMHSFCNEHQVYQMASQALESADSAKLILLDAAVGQAMNAGLQAIKKRYRTPFSPVMRQTRLRRTFYNLHLFQFKTGHRRTAPLQRVRSKLDTIPPDPVSQQE
jgi:phage-related protein